MLGAILIDPACITRVMEYIKPESFYRPQHQELFSALTRTFVSSQTIDFITVLEMAKREGIFDTDEDAKIYLTQLAQIVPSTANVESYAKIVQESLISQLDPGLPEGHRPLPGRFHRRPHPPGHGGAEHL